MREIKEEFNVYFYDELTEEAKEKAIEELKDINVHDNWWEFQYDDFKEKMNAIGFTVSNIYFSGFSSQGDGACFEGQMNDLRQFLLHHKMGNKFRKVLNQCDLFSIESIHSGRLYYHSGCMSINLNEYHSSLNAEEYNEFEQWVTEQLRDYADELYKSLEKEYDYMTSEEAIIETIECNEYEFTENGKLY